MQATGVAADIRRKFLGTFVLTPEMHKGKPVYRMRTHLPIHDTFGNVVNDAFLNIDTRYGWVASEKGGSPTFHNVLRSMGSAVSAPCPTSSSICRWEYHVGGPGSLGTSLSSALVH